MRGLPVVLALGILGFPGLAEPGASGSTKKPRHDLRAPPRTAFPPVSVLVVAELVGGGEHEDYYCPGLEWDWGDGNRSAQESDCEPFSTGAALERRFSARHAYRAAGSYSVTLTLRRASRTVAVGTVPVQVHGAPEE
ncbi:MAG TPA: PKD domain-containing protein [Vicinamibacteria bacterium]